MTTISASKIGALMVRVELITEAPAVFCQAGKDLVAGWVDTNYEVTLEEAVEHDIFTDFFLWSLWMYTSRMQNYKEFCTESVGRMTTWDIEVYWDEIVKEVEAAYDALCRSGSQSMASA